MLQYTIIVVLCASLICKNILQMPFRLDYVHPFYHVKDQDEKDATLQENEVKFALRTAQIVSQAYKPIARGEHIPEGERYKWIEWIKEHDNQVIILIIFIFFSVMHNMLCIY